MVFTRPPKKYAKTKAGRAEKERDRWAALTPEQRVAEEQERQRKNAEELKARQERQARWDREARESQERRWQQEAEEAKRAAERAEIDRRAGIQFPGHVVPPDWVKAYTLSHPATAQCESNSFNDELSEALEKTFPPLFKHDPIIGGIVHDDTIKNTPQREMAETLRQLILDVLDVAEQQLCTGEGATAQEFTFDRERFWTEFGTTTNLKACLNGLKAAYGTALDGGPLFDDSTQESMKRSAYMAYLLELDLMDAFEDADVRQQDDFIAELIECGALSRRDVTA
jgi:hypothetical protein